VDEIAERIRALGYMAPGSFARFLELTEIEEETGTPAAEEMVRQPATGHQTVDRVARTCSRPHRRPTTR
jgi:starvation-inducible DNA-binding protein